MRKNNFLTHGRTVMVIGAGAVGRAAANYLASQPAVRRLIVADKDKSKAHLVAVNAEIGAMYMGNFPKIESVSLDLTDEEQTIKIIEEKRPTVILNATTMLPSWFYIPLIKRRIKEIGLKDYYPGHTLAKDLVLIYKLMKSIKKSNVNVKVVNVSFPDNTHPVLAKVGLCPTVGAGNVDVTAQGVRKVVADRLGVPVHNISVTIIGHHALNWAPPEKVPYYIRIRMGERDLTEKFDTNELIRKANDLLVRDYDEQMAAASSARHVLSILDDKGEIVHGSGVDGIPGCLPVRLGASGVEIVLPKDITLEDVVRMNESGMRIDGIDKVEPDGTVVFTKETIKLLKDALGIDIHKMKLSEAEKMANELISAYNKLKKRYSSN